MARRTKKEVDRSLARELLRGLGYRVVRLLSPDKPDIFATVERGGRRVLLGIELTRYYVDASPLSKDGSPTVQLERFWEEVKTSIRRCVAQRPKLWNMTGDVYFKQKAVPKGRVARELARELVDLALEHQVAPDNSICVTNFPEAYPLIHKNIQEVNLCGTGCAERLSWTLRTTWASTARVVSEYIIEAIKKKSQKAKNYDWKTSEEHWFVICATGYPITGSAGPHPEFVDWHRSGMADTAKASGFDCILVWDRARGWCKPLWPDKNVVLLVR